MFYAPFFRVCYHILKQLQVSKTRYILVEHQSYHVSLNNKNSNQGILKGGSITVPMSSCLTGLDWSVWQIKTKIVISQTADSKPVKQEVNSTVILPPLVFPALSQGW
jgi:hypothetical protein